MPKRRLAIIVTVTGAFAAVTPAHSVEAAKRQIIDEACVAYERESAGPNGVLSPRQIQCRLSMGETYDEVADDIARLQARKAAQKRIQGRTNEAARSDALEKRKEALEAAPELCRMMVADFKEGRWFATTSTAFRLVTDNLNDGDYKAKLTAIGEFIARLGHNYSEKYQRQIVLGNLAAPQDFEEFNRLLSSLSNSIRSGAQAAKFYEENGRFSPNPSQPPNASGYAFKCFLETQFSSVNADPFDRALKIDQNGHVLE